MSVRIPDRKLCLRVAAAMIVSLTGLTLAATSAQAEDGWSPEGAVFTATNGEHRNEIVMYERAKNGELKYAGRFETGGRGEGGVNDPLQSQNSLAITEDHGYLLAVNAGSSTVSVFRIEREGLELMSVTPSGGGNPVSLAVRGDLVYVVNFGGDYHLAGFRLLPWGELKSVPDSRRTLSGLDPGASTVAFTPDGEKLVVTERTGNKIDIFSVNADGTLSNPVFTAAVGIEPFGFTFTPSGILLVTQTNGGPPHDGTISSYAIRADNTLELLTAKASSTGQAPCWILTNGHYAWVSNTASSDIGLVGIEAGGTLTSTGIAAKEVPPAGSGSALPLDSALAAYDKYFYVLYSNLGKIVGYRVEDTGTLHAITAVYPGKAAVGNQGMAAY